MGRNEQWNPKALAAEKKKSHQSRPEFKRT